MGRLVSEPWEKRNGQTSDCPQLADESSVLKDLDAFLLDLYESMHESVPHGLSVTL